MHQDDVVAVAASMRHLSREDAAPIAETMIRRCPNAAQYGITVESVLSLIPSVSPAALEMRRRAERSRELRNALVREIGAHEHPVQGLAPQERLNLVNVLQQEARARGWECRTYTHTPSGRYFYGFYLPGDAPAPVKGGQGRSNAPGWVQDIAPDTAKPLPVKPERRGPKRPLTI